MNNYSSLALVLTHKYYRSDGEAGRSQGASCIEYEGAATCVAKNADENAPEWYTLQFDADAWAAVGTPTDGTDFMPQANIASGTETVPGINTWYFDPSVDSNSRNTGYKYMPVEGYAPDDVNTTVFDQMYPTTGEFTGYVFYFEGISTNVDIHEATFDFCDTYDCTVVEEPVTPESASSLVAAATAIAAFVSLSFF